MCIRDRPIPIEDIQPSVSDSSAVADSVTLDNDTLTADPEPIPIEDIQPSVSDSSAVADSVK